MRPIAFLALLCILGACRGRTHDVPDAFHWQAELPPGSTIHLRTSTGQIEVTPAEGATANVVGSKRWRGRDAIHFAWVRNGNDVWVCAIMRPGGRCSRDYSPSQDNSSWLDMFSLFKHRATNLEASLTVELPRGVLVDAASTTGELEIHGTRAGVTARTVSGAISIDGAAGPIDAHSINGPVDVELDSLGPDDAINVKTVNGPVSAKIPPNTQGTVELATVNGSVETDFPITASGEMSGRGLHGRIGNSSRSISLKTVNGSVELTKGSGPPSGEPPVASGPRR
jgi:hypothetical protein